MNKLLVVVGPTAVGKTEVALRLAKKFNGELVSADSRQVYKELDIGTGKDIPKKSANYISNGYKVYLVDGVPLWGYDLVDAQAEFSVSQYAKAANEIIESIWEKNKLPVVVGGTGFYVHAILHGIETMDIPKNKSLRKQLDLMPVNELFEILAQLDATKAGSLNSSDKKNRVRLVRAIEVADANIRGIKKGSSAKAITADTFIIGITADREVLYKKISLRVLNRVKQGIEKEISKLLDRKISWDDQSMSSLGYREWKNYFKGEDSKESVIAKWTSNEQKYSKRQLTWFKRDKNIVWFDGTSQNYIQKVEHKVKKWYSSTNNENSKD